MSHRVAVIGGGASGLTAAISAAQSGADVTVYESGARVGRKILATGNGRCNMTNINADIKHYHGNDPQFILGVKNRFWVNETLDFFFSLGVLARVEEEGRVYPFSSQASAVLDVLRFGAEAHNVKTICSFEVSKVKKQGNAFKIIAYDGRETVADRVIIAAGGRAAPDFGSKGGGHEILKSLGHTITPLRPSLVQLKTDKDDVKSLKGIRVQASVTIGKHTEKGEIQFTDYGLSGVCVFNLSAYYTDEKTVSLDLLSDYSYESVAEMMWTRVANNPDLPLEEFFTGLLPKRVGQAILKQAGIAPLSRKAVTLGESEVEKLSKMLKHWEFKINGTMSWNNAQVTRGGALTDEFDPVTLMSRKVSGLYAAGEVLDIDGDCGGYNLQWAWASGYIAGKNAAK